MMEAAEPWNRDNPAARLSAFLHLAASRCLLSEAKVGPVSVIIVNELIQEALQMPFIQNDHVVEKIATACANPTLGYAIFPWTAEAGSLRLDAKALDDIDDLSIEIAPRSKIRYSGAESLGNASRSC